MERIREQYNMLPNGRLERKQFVYGLLKLALEELAKKPDPFTKGWCLFSICDAYAMLRDGESQFVWQWKFFEHAHTLGEKFTFWAVADQTLRFTLEQCGHGDLWWEMYFAACENNPEITPENEFIAFNAHRTATAFSPAGKVETLRKLVAEENYRLLLDGTKQSRNFPYYKAVYTANVSDDAEEIFAVGERLLQGLAGPEFEMKFIPGEWEYLATERNECYYARIAVGAAVNSLIRLDNIPLAKTLYEKAIIYGLPCSRYIERLIY